ncbi:MAG: Druantia anti-phage system protein DruA [Nitrospiraceae bacterium]
MDAELRSALPARVCGKRFHPRALRIIRETVQEYAHTSRTEITRQVCDRLGWVDHRGVRKELGAAVALLGFHRNGWIELPPARRAHRPTSRRQPLPEGFRVPQQALVGPLKSFGEIRLQPVASLADSRLWNGLIATYQDRGYAVFCGARMRYLIGSDHGIPGAMGFSAAALALRDRDRWIGWNREQRRVNRPLVVNCPAAS